MHNTIEVSIAHCEAQQAEVYIALLSEMGYDSFWQDDSTLKAYCTENRFDNNALTQLINNADLNGINLPKEYTVQVIAPKNWNADWESHYEPVPINDEVAIIAPFHEALAVQQNVVIIPKMSFGTGHHATTFLMMEAISKMDFTNKMVLDYGCGTGVLGIYAAYKKASKVIGVDIDEWCVENTLENIGLNNINQMEGLLGDLDDVGQAQFDVILANINFNILQKNMDKLVAKLKPGGELLLSGLLDSDLENMKNLVLSKGLRYINSNNQLNWIYLHFTNS
jgi:ribosomal protein L11 methyltransferase